MRYIAVIEGRPEPLEGANEWDAFAHLYERLTSQVSDPVKLFAVRTACGLFGRIGDDAFFTIIPAY